MFSTDFEDGTWNSRFFADGWAYISAAAGSLADRGYYMEMRDRTGFDFDGNGENDRGAIAFQPGMLLVITDESLGYGNTGSGDFPNQSPVDASPTAGDDTPDLGTAAFTSTGVSRYSDDGPDGWIDNYNDTTEPDGNWHHRFDCLTFDVTSMSGTDVGPAYPIPGNLVGDVTFDIGPTAASNCGQFLYWAADNDLDADGVIDSADNCLETPNALQEDGDSDGVGDACDNCTQFPNPSQCDYNLDGFGNHCDGDLNNDLFTNQIDLGRFRNEFRTPLENSHADLNCDGFVNQVDLGRMRQLFRNPPGPSAFVN